MFLKGVHRQQLWGVLLKFLCKDPLVISSMYLSHNFRGTEHASQEEISNWVKKEMENGKWQSHGYDYHDENLDKQWHRLAMFVFVSLPVLFATLWAYTPDRRMRDWALREAYLVLKEREAAGVEPVSRDFIDPEKVLAHLPSDEELKKAGVVINI